MYVVVNVKTHKTVNNLTVHGLIKYSLYFTTS